VIGREFDALLPLSVAFGCKFMAVDQTKIDVLQGRRRQTVAMRPIKCF
jgi:hypothetical protein